MNRNWNWLGFGGIAVAAMLVLGGCNQVGESGINQPVVITVTTNVAELAAARKAWATQRENTLKALLADPGRINSFDREDIKLLQEQRERSVAALIQLRDAATTSPKMRIEASRVLKFFDVALVSEQLVQWAQVDTQATLALLSELLGSRGLYPNDQPLPEVIRTFLVMCVSSKEVRVRNSAVHLAAWRGVAEAAEPLVRLLQQPSPPDLKLLKAAAKLCPSADLLSKLEAQIKDDESFTGTDALNAIADLAAATTNAALKEMAVAVCIRHLKQLQDRPYIDGGCMGAVEAVAKELPPEQAKAALMDIVRTSKWRLMRQMALTQLQEIEPATARQLAQETKLDLAASDDAVSRKSKYTPDEIAAILLRHQLLTQEAVDMVLKTSAQATQTNSDALAPDSAEGFFAAAGRLIAFDVETDACPNRHDRLIENFAQNSSRQFRPEAVLEHYASPNDGAQGWVKTGQGKYTVQFIMGDRLYRFAPKDLGDWYDVDAVVTAIHQALGDAGVAERFVALESGGQDASFIFAKPEGLQAAASELGLTLGKDLDQARKQGQAFEERALQEFRKSE